MKDENRKAMFAQSQSEMRLSELGRELEKDNENFKKQMQEGTVTKRVLNLKRKKLNETAREMTVLVNKITTEEFVKKRKALDTPERLQFLKDNNIKDRIFVKQDDGSVDEVSPPYGNFFEKVFKDPKFKEIVDQSFRERQKRKTLRSIRWSDATNQKR